METNNNASDDSGVVPFHYIHPEFELTHEQINSIRDKHLRLMLAHKKLQLILDLDHTLIHAKNMNKLTIEEKEGLKSMEDAYTMFGGRIAVKLRPGIREFLREISSMFEVSVYTMGCRLYGGEVVNNLLVSEAGFPGGSWVISRENCLIEKQKTLDVVLSHEQIVLIVDDSEDVWDERSRSNVVKIGKYNYFSKNNTENVHTENNVDTELDRVLGVLKAVHHAFFSGDSGSVDDHHTGGRTRDVREVLRMIMPNSGSQDDRKKRSRYDETVDVPAKRCKKLVKGLAATKAGTGPRFCEA